MVGCMWDWGQCRCLDAEDKNGEASSFPSYLFLSDKVSSKRVCEHKELYFFFSFFCFGGIFLVFWLVLDWKWINKSNYCRKLRFCTVHWHHQSNIRYRKEELQKRVLSEMKMNGKRRLKEATWMNITEWKTSSGKFKEAAFIICSSE